ncbi:MAG: hypothetical protein RLZZ601_238 [Pseudomonadota bacterium]|jgi:hypothetical protein
MSIATKKKPSPQTSKPVKEIKPAPAQAKASAKPIVAAKKTQQPVLKASTKDRIPTAKAPKTDISLVEAKPNKTLNKQAQLITLLEKPTGANLNELMQATGWQAHSIRGYISGTLRKRLSHNVFTLKVDGINHYRIESAK